MKFGAAGLTCGEKISSGRATRHRAEPRHLRSAAFGSPAGMSPLADCGRRQQRGALVTLSLSPQNQLSSSNCHLMTFNEAFGGRAMLLRLHHRCKNNRMLLLLSAQPTECKTSAQNLFSLLVDYVNRPPLKLTNKLKNLPINLLFFHLGGAEEKRSINRVCTKARNFQVYPHTPS